jgi:hypothetical protein
VNQYKHYWTEDSLNGIKEQRNYRYEKNMDGKFTDKPFDDFNHLLDGRMYAAVTLPEPKVLQTTVASSQFSIQFDKLTPNSTLIISIWSEKNMTTSCIMGMWNSMAAKLYIFHEIILQSPQPESIIAKLTSAIQFLSSKAIMTIKGFDIWGNKIFFGDWGGDLSSSFGKYGLWVRENKNYNEAGAIATATKLLDNKQIAILSECKHLLSQMSMWRIENKPEEGFGFARAVLTIVSTLHESGKLVPPPKPLPEYSIHKMRAVDKINRIVTAGITGKKAKSVSANGWMF